jgi:hypothetical protein
VVSCLRSSTDRTVLLRSEIFEVEILDFTSGVHTVLMSLQVRVTFLAYLRVHNELTSCALHFIYSPEGLRSGYLCKAHLIDEFHGHRAHPYRPIHEPPYKPADFPRNHTCVQESVSHRGAISSSDSSYQKFHQTNSNLPFPPPTAHQSPYVFLHCIYTHLGPDTNHSLQHKALPSAVFEFGPMPPASGARLVGDCQYGFVGTPFLGHG